MNCGEAKETLVDLAYQEPAAELTPEFKNHFAQCSSCSAEYMELLSTRRVLAAWTDEEPPTRWVFVPGQAKTGWRSWLSGWAQLRPAPALSLSFVLLVLFLSFGNVRVSWENGRFGFQSGVLNRAAPPAGGEGFGGTQDDLIAVVDKMMAESEARQNRQTLQFMQRLSDTLEYKQQMDLFQVKDELGLLHQNYYQALEKNSVLLEQAAKVIRLQNKY